MFTEYRLDNPDFLISFIKKNLVSIQYFKKRTTTYVRNIDHFTHAFTCDIPYLFALS